MNQQPNDSILLKSQAAMVRAAARARQIARQTGTDVVVIKDEQIVRLHMDKLIAAQENVEPEPTSAH